MVVIAIVSLRDINMTSYFIKKKAGFLKLYSVIMQRI